MSQIIAQAHHTARRNRMKFLAPGVQAIEQGLKTQTRRPIKPQPDEDGLSRVIATGEWHDTSGMIYVPPYGEKGHCLKVCEPWQRHLAAGGSAVFYSYEAVGPEGAGPWEPPDTMPSEATRLALIVNSVRVERLQAITEADAWAEGCPKGERTDNGAFFPADEDHEAYAEGWDCARDWFADLWDSIYGPGSWHANPLVWVYTFELLSPRGKP